MASRTITGTLAAFFTLVGAGMAIEPREIQGSWRLASVAGQAVATGDRQPYFSVEGDAISGYDGCNRFAGPLGGAIVVGQRACADAFVPLPLDLSDPVSHLAGAILEDGRLLLPARAGLPASVFTRGE